MSSIDNRKKFLAAWNVFREQDPLITHRTVEMFLKIAEDNGTKVSTLCAYFQFSQSVCSRHIGKLTDRGYKNANRLLPGLGLIMTVEDYDDYRSKRAFLTPKGVDLYSRFNQVLRGGFSDV